MAEFGDILFDLGMIVIDFLIHLVKPTVNLHKPGVNFFESLIKSFFEVLQNALDSFKDGICSLVDIAFGSRLVHFMGHSKHHITENILKCGVHGEAIPALDLISYSVLNCT